MQRVSLVTVSFWSSSYVGRAVECFRSEVRALGMEGEVVIVDHSEAHSEVEALKTVAPDRLIVQANRGYAAGVNTGVRHATGEILLVSNPDVALEAGALKELLQALEEYHIVGPQLVLGSLFFPPVEVQTPGAELGRYLASYSSRFRKRWIKKEALRSIHLWEAQKPVPVKFLVGAFLAFRRQTFGQLGPWDEGYFLYFEETDWFVRASSQGVSCALVPTARAYHQWGASAKPAENAQHMLASRLRYYKKNFPLLGRFLTALPLPAVAFPSEAVPSHLALGSPLWWLISPCPLGVPPFGLKAAEAFPEASIRAAFSFDSHPRTFTVAALDQGGRLYGPWRWDG